MITTYPDRSAWLAARLDRTDHPIGGSDVAAILGRSRFAGPWDVQQRLLGLVERTSDDLDHDNPMQGGRLLEPVLLGHYVERAQQEVDPTLTIIAHPAHSWARASLDGRVLSSDDGPGIVEVKTISFHSWPEVGADGAEIDFGGNPDADPARCGVPLEHLYQLGWYLACWPEARWCDYVAAYRSFRPHQIAVDAEGRVLRGVWSVDEVRILRVWRWPGVDRLVEQVAEWRERHVIRGEALDPDGSRACIAAMMALCRVDARTMTPDDVLLAREYEEAGAARKAASTRYDLARSRLLAALGSHAELHRNGRRAVWLAGKTLKTDL